MTDTADQGSSDHAASAPSLAGGSEPLGMSAAARQMLPHISPDEDGNVVMEWWNGERKITFYTGGKGEGLQVWGPNVIDEMSDIFADAKGFKNFRRAFEWLAEGKSALAPAVSEPTVPDGAGA